MQIKAITIDQIKNWNLNINQLRNYLALEIKRSEELQTQLREAEVELSKVKAEMVAFHEVSIKSFKMMTQAENDFDKNALITAIKNLRDQNLRIMAQIGKTKAQTKELKEHFSQAKSSDAHAKYARVMEALKSQAADIRVSYSSDDVLEMDDIVMEEGVSYEEAKEKVDQKKESWKTGEAPPADL